MAYLEIPGVDAAGNFPPKIRQAIVDSAEFDVEVQAALDYARGYGTNLPAAQFAFANRQFFRTSDRTMWMGIGGTWVLIGGVTELGWGTIGTISNINYYMDGATTIYVYRDGRAIDFRLRFGKSSGSLIAGEVPFQLAAAFLPYGAGDTVLNAVQRAGTGTPTPIACVLTGSGAITIGTPASTQNQLHVQGRFYLP